MNKYRTSDGGVTTILKIVIIGNHAVGKSCLCGRYVTDSFLEGDEKNLFNQFDQSVIRMIDGQRIQLNIHDTTTHPAYDRLRSLIYPFADLILICISIADRESFINVKSKWITEIKKNSVKVPFMLVGTKTDLRNNQNQLDYIRFEEGVKLAEKVNACKYLECSALANENVEIIFDSAIRLILLNYNRNNCCILL